MDKAWGQKILYFSLLWFKTKTEDNKYWTPWRKTFTWWGRSCSILNRRGNIESSVNLNFVRKWITLRALFYLIYFIFNKWNINHRQVYSIVILKCHFSGIRQILFRTTCIYLFVEFFFSLHVSNKESTIRCSNLFEDFPQGSRIFKLITFKWVFHRPIAVRSNVKHQVIREHRIIETTEGKSCRWWSCEQNLQLSNGSIGSK